MLAEKIYKVQKELEVKRDLRGKKGQSASQQPNGPGSVSASLPPSGPESVQSSHGPPSVGSMMTSPGPVKGVPVEVALESSKTEFEEAKKRQMMVSFFNPRGITDLRTWDYSVLK